MAFGGEVDGPPDPASPPLVFRATIGAMFDRAPSPDTIDRIGRALGRFDLRLLGDDEERLRIHTQHLASEYLAPRLRSPDSPLVVAVVGVSGSGKSTLINSIARRRISAEGRLRPTTTEPVAWAGDELPGTLDALRHRLPGRLVDTLRPPPKSLVIVDTPPPGVTGPDGDSIAAQILDVADACILVTGGTRYADGAGFDLAARAQARGIPTVFVLNRLPATPELSGVIVGDFAAKLAARGHIERAASELIVPISEGPVSEDSGGLPGDWITGLRKEVETLADPESRPSLLEHVVARSTLILVGALASLRAMLITAEARRADLTDPVRIAYGRAADDLLLAVRSGEYAETGFDPDTFADTLAAAAARRASRASREVTDRWAEMAPELVDSSKLGHGPDVPAAAHERISWWEADLPSLAAELGSKRLRDRNAGRLIDTVRLSIADRHHVPRGKYARLMRKLPGMVDAARLLLEEELVGILDADSNRFTASLGPSLPDGLLADLTLEVGQ
jgi:hypothetical protein